MTDISYSARTLTVGDNIVEFDHQISEFLIWDDNLIIVRFRVPQGTVHNRNVVAIDNDGNEIWQIPKATVDQEDNPYTSIYKKDGDLWVRCYWDRAYQVDIDTGELLDERVVR